MTFEEYVVLVESLGEDHLMHMDRNSAMAQLSEFSKKNPEMYKSFREQLKKNRKRNWRLNG